MDYTVMEKPGFRVVGKSRRISWENGANKTTVPQFWNDVMPDGTFKKLHVLAGGSVTGGMSLGLCVDYNSAAKEFTYVIGFESDADPGEFGVFEVPAATYAVFKAVGPVGKAIQDVWDYAMGEFWETEPYVHGSGCEIEAYPFGDPHAENYVTEIWIPVRAK